MSLQCYSLHRTLSEGEERRQCDVGANTSGLFSYRNRTGSVRYANGSLGRMVLMGL